MPYVRFTLLLSIVEKCESCILAVCEGTLKKRKLTVMAKHIYDKFGNKTGEILSDEEHSERQSGGGGGLSLSFEDEAKLIFYGYIGLVLFCAFFSDESLAVIKNYALSVILLGISVYFGTKFSKVTFFYFFLFFSILSIILGLYLIYNEWYLQKVDMRSVLLLLGNLVPVILSFMLLLVMIFVEIKTKRNIKRDADLHSK